MTLNASTGEVNISDNFRLSKRAKIWKHRVSQRNYRAKCISKSPIRLIEMGTARPQNPRSSNFKRNVLIYHQASTEQHFQPASFNRYLQFSPRYEYFQPRVRLGIHRQILIMRHLRICTSASALKPRNALTVRSK